MAETVPRPWWEAYVGNFVVGLLLALLLLFAGMTTQNTAKIGALEAAVLKGNDVLTRIEAKMDTAKLVREFNDKQK